MERLVNGDLIKDLTFAVLHQRISLCPLQGFPKVWYVLNLLFTALKYVGELLTEKSAWESIELHFVDLKSAWRNIVPLHLFCILLSD